MHVNLKRVSTSHDEGVIEQIAPVTKVVISQIDPGPMSSMVSVPGKSEQVSRSTICGSQSNFHPQNKLPLQLNMHFTISRIDY